MPPPHRPAVARAACALALALAGLSLTAGAAVSGALSPAASSESGSPAPAYPENTSAPEADDGDIVTLPGRTAESERLFLAATTAVEPLIDADAILAAVEEADIDDGVRVYLGVDRTPSSSSSAAQLVRGLLLFGETDALADDWLENGRTDGYVGDDWIVVGVILPGDTGGISDVSIDVGRNMEVTAEGGLEALEATGAAAFAAGDYTAALSDLAVAAGNGMEPRFDPAPWAAGAGGLLLAGLAGYGAVVARRRWVAVKTTVRTKEAATLASRSRSLAKRLRALDREPPAIVGQGPVAAAMRGLREGSAELAEVDADRARALAGGGAAGEALGERDIGELTAICERLQARLDALEGIRLLLRGDAASRRAWNRQIAGHRARLEAAAQALDTPGARDLPAARDLLAIAIRQTNELDACKIEAARLTRLNPESARTTGSYALLDRIHTLRNDLDWVLGALANQARQSRIALPSRALEEARLLVTGDGRHRPADGDVLGQIALAAGQAADAAAESDRNVNDTAALPGARP